MGIPLITVEYSDNGGGLDLISSPTKTPEFSATRSLNVDYSDDGAIQTRFGSNRLNSIQHNSGDRTLFLYDYRKSDGTIVQIVCNGTTIAHGLTNPVNQVTGLNATLPIPCMAFSVSSDNEYALWGNGLDTNLKFDGTTWSNLSIERPIAPSGADNGAGTLGAGEYEYYQSFAKTSGGVIEQESELSPVSVTVTIGADRQIRLTIAVSTDPQVNSRVIYRVSPTSTGVAYRRTTVGNNTDTTYDDNTLADGTIEADYDKQNAPKSDVFCNYNGVVYYKDNNKPTDFLNSRNGQPWYVAENTRSILDSEIRCMRVAFNVLVIGTKTGIWTIDYSGNLRRVSFGIGIINNRCADGDTFLYIVTTNKKIYKLSPSDLNQDQFDLSSPISNWIDPTIAQIGSSSNDLICLKYLNKPNIAKVFVSVPLVASTNTHFLVYNERQSDIRQKHVWQYYDNNTVNALNTFIINNNIELVGGDYNGFFWKLENLSMYGDGAEENGTSTGSNTLSTLNDTTKTWIVNAYAGIKVRIIDGEGNGQIKTIVSNTIDELTLSSNWTTTPDDTSAYTIGGYINYHYSNWKSIVDSYEVLKQLWFIWLNANASGNYNIKLILQFDFDTTISNQVEILVNLRSENSIWGAFIWGSAVWGSHSVFLDRFRYYARFKTVRVIFYHDKAGQNWKINNYALTAQNMGFIFNPL